MLSGTWMVDTTISSKCVYNPFTLFAIITISHVFFFQSVIPVCSFILSSIIKFGQFNKAKSVRINPIPTEIIELHLSSEEIYMKLQCLRDIKRNVTVRCREKIIEDFFLSLSLGPSEKMASLNLD